MKKKKKMIRGLPFESFLGGFEAASSSLVGVACSSVGWFSSSLSCSSAMFVGFVFVFRFYGDHGMEWR